MRLELSPDSHWNVTTPELVPAACTAGFPSLGANADRVDDAYAAAEVRCHEVLALVVSDDDSATLTAAGQLAEAAQTIRAEWVLTVFSAVPRPDAIRRCAKVFDDVSTGMAVEFDPLGPVATINDGMEVVRAARSGGRAGLLIDSWHFFGESTWDDLATVPSTTSPTCSSLSPWSTAAGTVASAQRSSAQIGVMLRSAS
ncbi:MAG: hypothetical protein QOD39_735 [Mycobacterium sp.]|nr:hypothetical protein [Mycobacterium sp.]